MLILFGLLACTLQFVWFVMFCLCLGRVGSGCCFMLVFWCFVFKAFGYFGGGGFAVVSFLVWA